MLPKIGRHRRPLEGLAVSPSGLLGYYAPDSGPLQLAWLFGFGYPKSPLRGGTIMIDALTGRLIQPRYSVSMPAEPGIRRVIDAQRPAPPNPSSGLRPRQGGLRSEQAVQIARETLGKLGVRYPLHLQGLQTLKGNDWSISFSVTANGGYFIDIDSETGTTKQISATLQMLPSQIADPRNSASEKLAYKLLRTLVPEGPVAPPAIGWGQGADAIFLSLEKGRPFFNLNPTYGYSIGYWPEKGMLLHFTTCPELPPVNAMSPRVSAAAAGKKLEAYGRSHIADDGVAKSLYDSQFGSGRLQPQLGYYKFKDEDKARLVWQGMALQRAGKKEWEGGAMRMYVDAVTGEMIAPDDPGMG